jgi:putative endopeptidase
MDETNIPSPEYARYGSFDKLGEDNQKQLKDLITGIAAKKHDKESIPQKSATYTIWVWIALRSKNKEQPLFKLNIQSIADMKNIKELTNMLAELYLKGTGAFFSVFAEANPANSNMNIAWLWQTGLGIGDRDYYLEKETQPIRDQYVVLLN